MCFAQIRLADQPQRQQHDRKRDANHQLLALVRAAVLVTMLMRMLVMLVFVMVIIVVVMVMMLVTAAAFAVVMMAMLMLVVIIVLVMMPAARASRVGRLFRFVEENFRIGFDFLHLRIRRLAYFLKAVSGRFQSNLLLHIIDRHAHHTRQLLQGAFHLCRAVRAVNVQLPRLLDVPLRLCGRFVEENLRVGFDFLHLCVRCLAHFLKAVGRCFQRNLLLHIIDRHAHHTRQLLQRAFHLCRAVRAVNVDFPRFLHGFRRPFRIYSESRCSPDGIVQRTNM